MLLPATRAGGTGVHDAADRRSEAAADLTAETFAAAIVARRRFRPGVAPAGAWLLTIAHRKLVDYQRRGFAEEGGGTHTTASSGTTRESDPLRTREAIEPSSALANNHAAVRMGDATARED